MKNDKPIGIFDSGIGGLTVLKEIVSILPNENIIYLGDTARVPYGSKSKDIIIKYSIQNTKFLLKHKIKLLVIACNTSSSYSIPILQKKFNDLPIIGVIKPGAQAAVKNTKNLKIGVIATRATVNSNSYVKEIKKISKNINVYVKATPLLVPLIEEGWFDLVYNNSNFSHKQKVYHMKIIKQIALDYLSYFKNKKIDVLVLGCTHYPMIKDVLQEIMGNKVKIIDSAVETALIVKNTLDNKKLLNYRNQKGYLKFFVTDNPNNFRLIGSLILNKKIHFVKKIDLYSLESY